jgi:phage terminase Nu1 subunit (DNA packaging protein)
LGSDIGGLDLVQERAALAKTQREGIEIKNAVARGEYAPISLLSEVLATASQSVVERFEQLPSQLKKNCPELPDAARDQIMTLLAAARNEWVRATSALVVAKSEEQDIETEVIEA